MKGDHVKDLKDSEGKDIWLCGGGKLAGSLLANRLIDEVHIKENPLIPGEGISLFENSSCTTGAELPGCQQYESGVVLKKYRIIY
jgi:dihydrofolate reductase